MGKDTDEFDALTEANFEANARWFEIPAVVRVRALNEEDALIWIRDCAIFLETEADQGNGPVVRLLDR